MFYNLCSTDILIVKIQIETTNSKVVCSKYLAKMLLSHLLGHLYQKFLFNVHNVSYKRLEDTFMPVGIFFCNWQQKNASAITKVSLCLFSNPTNSTSPQIIFIVRIKNLFTSSPNIVA